MKITDVTVTLFAWDDIPPTRYAADTGLFSGWSPLGLGYAIDFELIERNKTGILK